MPMPRPVKPLVTGGMKVNAYAVLCRAVEEGIAIGWMRAHKHTDKPTELEIKDQIEQAVMGAICEYFEFEEREQ